MYALEGGRVVVGGFPSEGDELLADVPLGLVGPPYESPGLVGPAGLFPEDRFDLVVGRGGGDGDCMTDRVDVHPPGDDPGGGEGFAGAVTGGDRGVPVGDD